MREVTRWATITIGVLITLIGIALLVLPGPGFIVIGLGMALLGREIPWVQRILDRMIEFLRPYYCSARAWVREKLGKRNDKESCLRKKISVVPGKKF